MRYDWEGRLTSSPRAADSAPDVQTIGGHGESRRSYQRAVWRETVVLACPARTRRRKGFGRAGGRFGG